MKKYKEKEEVPEWLLKSREKWQYNGQRRPPFAIAPKPGQRSVWDFPRPPALVPSDRKVEVFTQGILLASSTKALELLETASPPTYYVPPDRVALDLLIPMAGTGSFCEWKGKAGYWAYKENPSKAIAWSYPSPFQAYAPLTDYLGFYPQYADCYLDGEKVTPQPGGFYAGWVTRELCGPFKGNPGTGHW